LSKTDFTCLPSNLLGKNFDFRNSTK